MKFQFSTSFILLMTAFFGICVGGMLPFWRELGSGDKAHLPKILLLMGPIHGPVSVCSLCDGSQNVDARNGSGVCDGRGGCHVGILESQMRDNAQAP